VVVAPGVSKHGATTTDCAIVFQADSLFPWMTVERNAMFGLRSRGLPTDVARERANAWLTRVGLPEEVVHLKPRQLSGGMRQRVNLVRALALEPKVILMDEPFASLDYQTREELQVELMRLSGMNSMTTVFVTHDVPEAVLLADRVVVMDPERKGISEIFEMPWGRDRSLDLKATSSFADMCGKLSHAVRSS
jgi:NitT/TauT family transport system ATP-binding protein